MTTLETLWQKIAAVPQPRSPDGREYFCAVCGKPFAFMEEPLHLAADMNGTPPNRAVHSECWKE